MGNWIDLKENLVQYMKNIELNVIFSNPQIPDQQNTLGLFSSQLADLQHV